MYRITPDRAEDQQINLPSSKSITHRILILACLNRGTTKIFNALRSEDTEITITALQKMGATIDVDHDNLLISKQIGETTDF